MKVSGWVQLTCRAGILAILEALRAVAVTEFTFRHFAIPTSSI